MSVFSDKLSAFMKEKGMTTYALAKYCGMDRSNVYKIVEGTRPLHSENKVKKIANVLALSPYECKELLQAWRITEVGEYIFFERKLIQDFICHLNANPNLLLPKQNKEMSADNREDIYNNMLLKGKNNLYVFIKHIIEKEVLVENPSIDLICQPENSFLYNLLALYGNERGNVTVRHLICLESLTVEKENKYNLKGLDVLTPLLMSSCCYQVYYYYDKVQSHFYNLNILPYMILTQQDALLVSSDFEYGFSIHNKEQIQLFKQMFEEYISNDNIQELFKDVLHVQELISTYSDLSENTITAVLSSGPMSAAVPFQIIEKYVRPEKRKEMESFCNKTIDYVNCCIEQQNYKNFFTEDGVRDFMENSHIVDLMADDIEDFNKEDRLYVLEQMIWLLKNKEVDGYMIRPGMINMQRDFYMTVYKKGCINILYKNSNACWRLLAINEKSLGISFYNFMEHLSESDYVYDRNGTLERMEALLKEYRDRFGKI